MKNVKNLLLFCAAFGIILSTGCNCGGSDSKSPVAPPAVKPLTPAPLPPAAITLTTTVLFGDRSAVVGPLDTSFTDKGPDGAQCSNNGICETAPARIGSSFFSSIVVNFLFQPAVGGNPATLDMSFNYNDLYQNQKKKSRTFYNGAIIPTYQFGHDFSLSDLGGSFRNLQATINATPAGAGSISFNPALNPGTPSRRVNSMVTVRFNVSTPPPAPVQPASVAPTPGQSPNAK